MEHAFSGPKHMLEQGDKFAYVEGNVPLFRYQLAIQLLTRRFRCFIKE